MKNLRSVFCLAILIVPGSFARGQSNDSVDIQLSPDRVAVKSKATVTITINVNVPTGAGDGVGLGDPKFDVRIPGKGTLRPNKSAGRNVDWLADFNDVFIIKRTGNGRVADGTAVFTYQLDDDTPPGELTIAVVGSQGIRLLDVTELGNPLYRGSKRLIITQTPGTGPVEPPTDPPFGSTPTAVNPTPEMLRRAGELAIILGLVAFGNAVITRRRPPTPKPKPETPKPPPEQPPVKENQPQKQDDKPSPFVRVQLRVTPDNVKGAAEGVFSFRVSLAPGDAAKATIEHTEFTCSQPGYKPTSDDTDSGSCPIPWEWETVRVTFTAKVHVVGTDGKPLAKQPAPVTETVTVMGAYPRIGIWFPSMPWKTDATGFDGVPLDAKLELFGTTFDGANETIRVDRATSQIGGRMWDKLRGVSEGRPEWVPPFMLREEREYEEIALTVHSSWIGGEMWKRATASRKPFPKLQPDICTVQLYGCTLTHKASPAWFVPLPGTPLTIRAELGTRHGPIRRDPFGKESVHAEGAGIRIEVEDRSQGPPQVTNGCRRPPTPPTRGKIWSVGTVRVAGDGCLCTVADPIAPDDPQTHGIIVLGKYAVERGNDPIHAGPVMYKFEVRDGLGTEVKFQGACRVSLGALVLETGGNDFRIYEYRPHLFGAEFMDGTSDRIDSLSDYWKPDLKLVWEFAVVNAKGDPLAFAERVEKPAFKPDSWVGRPDHFMRFPLVIGHMPHGYKSTHIDMKVPSYREYEVTDDDRAKSLHLRRRWHELAPQFAKVEEGLPWADEGKWHDRVLMLGVRIELRNGQGLLLATSDRILDGQRTPSEFVWGDHTFLFVLNALRLRLQDQLGNPFTNRRFRLELKEKGKVIFKREGTTTTDALLEEPTPPNIDSGTLTLWQGEGASKVEEAVFDLLFDLAKPEDDEGKSARLNNLGLFADPKTVDRRTDQLERSVERGKQLYQWCFSTDGESDVPKQLEELHQNGMPKPS